jgi:hypothetical protein
MIMRASFTLSCLLAALAAGKAAAAPLSFSYGGQLTQGDEVVAGPVSLELRFYRVASGGSPIKSNGAAIVAPFSNVSLDEGVFQVEVDSSLLDATQMSAIFDTEEAVYVEVRDTTSAVTYPRQRLVSMPYALKVPVDGKRARFGSDGRLTVGPGTNAGANEFLTTDSSGNLIWATPSGGGSNPFGSQIDDADVSSLSQSKITNLVSDLAAKADAATVTAALGGKASSSHSHTIAGDVTGDIGATAVTKLRGFPIDTTSPSTGQVLKWDGSKWAPSADEGVGDVPNPLPAVDGAALTNVNASALRSSPIAATAPSTAQVLKWNGAAWAPATDANSGGTVTSITAGYGLTGGTITGSGTIALASPIDAAKIQGRAISSTAPSNGHVLKWNSSASSWEAAPDDGGVAGAISTGQNLGIADATTGDIYESTSSPNMRFRRLKEGVGIDLTQNADDVTVGIGPGGISSTELANDSVTSAAIATDAVTADEIAAGAVGNAELAADTVTSAKIQDGTIVNADISGTAAISGDKISGGTISNFASTGIDDNAAATSVTISATGNVGIGTTAPSYKLHVIGSAGLSSGTAWTNASDIRLKDIAGDYDLGLSEIMQLHTVRFTYKQDNPLGIPAGNLRTGFIAQEVREVIPEAVIERPDGYLELNVDPIHWAVVNAIKELGSDSQRQTADISELRAENEQLKAESERLTAESEQLRAESEQLRAESEQLRAAFCAKFLEAAICRDYY